MAGHLTIAIALILLLWPEVIGPEPEMVVSLGGQKKSSPSRQENLKSSQSQLASMELGSIGKLDKEAFILAFKRQAHKDLYTCLRAWKKSPNELLINAMLQQDSGLLRSIRFGDKEEDIPKCMEDAISKMNFIHISPSMSQPEIDLQWLVSW